MVFTVLFILITTKLGLQWINASEGFEDFGSLVGTQFFESVIILSLWLQTVLFQVISAIEKCGPEVNSKLNDLYFIQHNGLQW